MAKVRKQGPDGKLYWVDPSEAGDEAAAGGPPIGTWCRVRVGATGHIVSGVVTRVANDRQAMQLFVPPDPDFAVGAKGLSLSCVARANAGEDARVNWYEVID